MSEKKGFFSSLFGSSKSGGCCSMEIVEEPKKKGDCCNMEIIEEETGCCCGSDTVQGASGSEPEQADILILGPGCKNCQALEVNVEEALSKMGKDIAVGHITDFNKIAAYGIMSTPGLVVNGKVVSSGKVLKPDAIISILENSQPSVN